MALRPVTNNLNIQKAQQDTHTHHMTRSFSGQALRRAFNKAHFSRDQQDWDAHADLQRRYKQLQVRIRWAVANLAPYKSLGPDGFYPVLLRREPSYWLVLSLTFLDLPWLLAVGHVPEALKIARAVFMPEGGKPSKRGGADTLLPRKGSAPTTGVWRKFSP